MLSLSEVASSCARLARSHRCAGDATPIRCGSGTHRHCHSIGSTARGPYAIAHYHFPVTSRFRGRGAAAFGAIADGLRSVAPRRVAGETTGHGAAFREQAAQYGLLLPSAGARDCEGDRQ